MLEHELPLTHPETAWLLYAVTPAMAAAGLMLGALLVRSQLALLLVIIRTRHARRNLAALSAQSVPDPALFWLPEPLAPARLVSLSLTLTIGIAVSLMLIIPPGLALLLAPCLLALLLLLGERVARRRYISGLERDLTPAIGRLSALLKAGLGLRPALERLVGDLQPGPLREEWTFLVARQGVPINGGGIATPRQVIAALADQSLSRRHGVLLNHLGASVEQPQEVLARRCEAAYTALQLSDRRRDEALTELAQMRYSGMAVGMAGMVMALYLTWSQWDRVVRAYSSPLGAVVAVVVLGALALPIFGGMLLTHVEDSEY